MSFVQLKVMDYKQLKLGYYFQTEHLHQECKVLIFFFLYAFFLIICSTEEMLNLERVTQASKTPSFAYSPVST